MSILDRIFRRSRTGSERQRQDILRYDINQYDIRSFDKAIVEMDLIRASIDARARNIGKMQLEAVMYLWLTGITTVTRSSSTRLMRLIMVQPTLPVSLLHTVMLLP